MSRTDNTLPWRLWRDNDLAFYRAHARWRARHHSVISADVRLASRRQRRTAREVLRRGETPEPYRHRHSVQWDAI